MQPDQSIPEFHHRTNSRSRSIRITISPKGELIVTTPPRFPTDRIYPFLLKSRDWIEKHLALHHRRLQVVEENTVLYFGEALPLKLASKPTAPAIQVLEDSMVINPIARTKDSVARLFTRWMKSEAERYIVRRVSEIAKRAGHTYSTVQLKDTTSRWGSCSTRGNLQFSWRLIQAPKEVIDYVIMHELAHLKHMDHSTRFWQYVERLDPHYTVHKRWLRLHGAALHQDFAFDPHVLDSA